MDPFNIHDFHKIVSTAIILGTFEPDICEIVDNRTRRSLIYQIAISHKNQLIKQLKYFGARTMNSLHNIDSLFG